MTKLKPEKNIVIQELFERLQSRAMIML